MPKSLFEKALAAEGITGKLADLARSIYQQESGSGENTQTSNAGAHGGMQIIPSTFKSVADKGWDINNPEHNARAGIRYLKQLDKQSGGVPELTAAGYYGGPGGMEKAKRGIAVRDPRNPNAPNTLEYGRQVANRLPGTKPASILSIPDNQMPQLSDLIIAQAPAAAPVVVAQAPVQQPPVALNTGGIAPTEGQQVASAAGPSVNNPWAALGDLMPGRAEAGMQPADLNYGNQLAMKATSRAPQVFEDAGNNAERMHSILKKFGLGRYSQESERYQATVPEFTIPA